MNTLALRPSPSILRLADLLMLAVAMVWGAGYGVAKQALAYYPVLGFIGIRFAATLCVLLPFWWRNPPAARRAALRAGLPLGGLMLAIFLCEIFGVAYTRAANAAFLISLCIVFTPFMEWWLAGRRPDTGAFVFAGVSLAGAALLSGSLDTHVGIGDGLMLAAAILRALFVCLTARMTRDGAAPALALTTVQSGVVGLGAVAIGILAGGLPVVPLAPAFWGAMAFQVLGCTIFAFFAQTWALRYSPPSRVALLTGSEPVFGALFAVVWLGEQLGPTAWVGGAMIVAASLWATSRKT